MSHTPAARRRTPSIASDVLSDLYADAWFLAQQDVLANANAPTVVGYSPAERVANARRQEEHARHIRTLTAW